MGMQQTCSLLAQLPFVSEKEFEHVFAQVFFFGGRLVSGANWPAVPFTAFLFIAPAVIWLKFVGLYLSSHLAGGPALMVFGYAHVIMQEILCVCVHACVHVCVYMRIRERAYQCVYICIYVCACLCTCVHAPMCVLDASKWIVDSVAMCQKSNSYWHVASVPYPHDVSAFFSAQRKHKESSDARVHQAGCASCLPRLFYVNSSKTRLQLHFPPGWSLLPPDNFVHRPGNHPAQRAWRGEWLCP